MLSLAFSKNMNKCWKKEYKLDEYRKLGLEIGKNVLINYDVFLDGCGKIKIGDNCVITKLCMILSHDASSKMVGFDSIEGLTEIGNNVFIGIRSIILPNIKIGNNVIIGAGSVITKNIPENEVWAGNPARKICTIEEYKNKLKERGINEKK
jgi:maltose O-acetyltransferase